MSALLSELSLYNLTLQHASVITHAIAGSFSRAKAQEIVVAKGKVLELLRPDEEGKLISIIQTDVFGIIRDVKPFRVPGSEMDYIIVASDSGRISILSYDATTNSFIKVHEETYGKSGCRRVVAGQYLAVDPNGRAVMIAAVERQKFVYILNRDNQMKLTISSPLEAHKSHTIVFSTVGLDVGFENPQFACIELDYEQEIPADGSPMKTVTFYELDLMLNHVVRKDSKRTHEAANMLIPVPGGDKGPGGVLVCAENCVVYQSLDQDPLLAPLPQRTGHDEKQGILLVNYVTHVQKNMFFFLAQSELGDLFKIELEINNDEVIDIKIKYFDSIPPSTSICMLKSGFLFSASEADSHYFLQFINIGQDDPICTTKATKFDVYSYFQPRKLTNLALIDQIDGLGLITDMKVANLAKEEAPQIYALCGKGNRSSLRVLRHGLAVVEIGTSSIPGVPTAVWAIKKNLDDEYMTYIVVSFINATVVLSVTEGNVRDVDNSGLLSDTQTLAVYTMSDSSIVQVHPNGVRHIKQNNDNSNHQVNEWKTPGQKSITKCAGNESQLVIALSGGELIYFELNTQYMLIDLHRKDISVDIASLTIAPVHSGLLRSDMMAVGSFDNTVRLLSLQSDSPFEQVSMQAVPSQPQSLLLINMHDTDTTALSLYVGLASGAMYHSNINKTDGTLKDTRKRFLGGQGVRLFAVKIESRNAVLALSSRSWLAYSHQNKFQITPLSYQNLDYASSFSSDMCPEGIVGVSGSSLRIISVDKLGELFNSQAISLRYTPRKFIIHGTTNNLIIIESDQNSFPTDIANSKLPPKEQSQNNNMTDEEEDEPVYFANPPTAGRGKWASCIRIMDAKTMQTKSFIELDQDEAAFSLTEVKFESRAYENFIAVGTVVGLKYAPREHKGAFIHIYKVSDDGSSLSLIHKTPVEAPVLALCAWNDRLLAGVGKTLRVYELGKKKLLRKTENSKFPACIQSIRTIEDRIYVGDICESFQIVVYRSDTKNLSIIADSLSPRYLTASSILDYDTTVGADKFGNLFISRLPLSVSKQLVKDPSSFVASGKYGELLVDQLPKMKDIVQYHVGEMITSLQKVSLVPGGAEVIIYGTIMGSMGVFVSFNNREEHEFMFQLEMLLRQALPPLCGRDHQAYRSYYAPVKDCIDGDLCEQIGNLSKEQLDEICEELSMTPATLKMRLEDMWNKFL